MNVQLTSEIRELTADELGAVAGGLTGPGGIDNTGVILLIGFGAWVGGAVGYLLDWIFD
jgi:hypothetical protein